MRIHCLFIVLLAGLCWSAYAQVPQAFQYQTIVRDGAGNPIVNQEVGFKISLLRASATGSIIYSETHHVTTSDQGMVTLKIGRGTIASGSWDAVDWKKYKWFLRVAIDKSGGTSYVVMGNTELLSVPYALQAGEAGSWDENSGKTTTLTQVGIGTSNPSGVLSVQGNASIPSDTALFQVKDKDGRVVFAVYNNGAELIVDETSKGGRGGFAVSGRSHVKSDSLQDLLLITPDSARIYINDSESKGGRGGFAVGGRTPAKGLYDPYLYVMPDSTRIYVNEPAGKGGRGGFAVGGRTPGKGITQDYTRLTPENYLIGHQSGHKISTGLYNTFLGYQSGVENTTGSSNIFIGNQAGNKNTSGYHNSFIGYRSGYNSTSGQKNILLGYYSGLNLSSGKNNLAIGDSSGLNIGSSINNVFIGNQTGVNTKGNFNTFIGFQAGHAVTGTPTQGFGIQNVFIGYQAGINHLSGLLMVNSGPPLNMMLPYFYGSYNVCIGGRSGASLRGSTLYQANSNVFVGSSSGHNTTRGAENVFIGSDAGLKDTSGSNNVFVGQKAGYSNLSGNYNVFIGNSAGYSETGSGKLYVDNSSTSSPLIYGDFSSNYLNINGSLGVNQIPYYSLDINGEIASRSSNGFRIRGTTYSTILRQDGTDYYFLITNSGDPDGTWNGFRPFRIQCSTGMVSIANGAITALDGSRVGMGRTAVTNKLEVEGNASKTTAGSWLANSDIRIKTAITNIPNAQETILKLHPVQFRYNEAWMNRHPSIEDKQYYNFIAQEYAAVFPSAVQGSGEYLQEGDSELLQIDTYNSQIVAIKALQEVILENREQKQSIARHEAENIHLQEELDQMKKEIMELKKMLEGLSK